MRCITIAAALFVCVVTGAAQAQDPSCGLAVAENGVVGAGRTATLQVEVSLLQQTMTGSEAANLYQRLAFGQRIPLMTDLWTNMSKGNVSNLTVGKFAGMMGRLGIKFDPAEIPRKTSGFSRLGSTLALVGGALTAWSVTDTFNADRAAGFPGAAVALNMVTTALGCGKVVCRNKSGELFPCKDLASEPPEQGPCPDGSAVDPASGSCPASSADPGDGDSSGGQSCIAGHHWDPVAGACVPNGGRTGGGTQVPAGGWPGAPGGGPDSGPGNPGSRVGWCGVHNDGKAWCSGLSWNECVQCLQDNYHVNPN